MNFISTRGGEKVTGAQAIVQGLAKDGGLFVPETFPTVSSEELSAMETMNYPERAAFVLGKYLADDLGSDYLKEICEKAYATFTGDDPAPLVKLDDGFFILELFHGPTCAFKDMALTVLPYLLKRSQEVTGIKEDVLILAATSGDTGKAALEGFKDVPGTKVAVFYPDEGVAKMQRLQMATQSGNNVFVSAVKGNFDDCQRAVKNLFASAEFNAALKEKGARLSSANSINFGRLAPQIAYYFSSYLDLLTSRQIERGTEIDFVVPTGNFGDILAGWYAKQMGLPVRKLICASNKNRVLADFFETGKYDVKREFHRTMSPSMDILVSSNLERLIFEMSGRNTALTESRMADLKKKGKYSITEEEKNDISEVFFADYTEEEDCLETISAVFEEYGYVCDPHTAVAVSVADAYVGYTGADAPTVILSTASPYKFSQNVLKAITGKTTKDAFNAADRLYEQTATPIPENITALKTKEKRFNEVIEKTQTVDAIMRFIGK